MDFEEYLAEILKSDGNQKALDVLTAYKASLLKTAKKVLFYLSDSFPDQPANRVRYPSIILMDINTPRKNRMHHLSTFIPQGENMKGILSKEIILDISKGWDITLPHNMNSLLQGNVTKNRVILLMRKKGVLKDGVAILLPEK